MKVLLVDDDRDLVDQLNFALRRAGFDTGYRVNVCGVKANTAIVVAGLPRAARVRGRGEPSRRTIGPRIRWPWAHQSSRKAAAGRMARGVQTRSHRVSVPS